MAHAKIGIKRCMGGHLGFWITATFCYHEKKEISSMQCKSWFKISPDMLQLVNIKEPSVWFESVLWTPYSPHNESNLPCSCPVWQCCVSICYFQIVLQSANKTGCLRRWWGSPSCSSSAPAPLPQHYKQRLYVICQQQHMSLAMGEKGEPSPPLVRWKQKFSRNKTK